MTPIQTAEEVQELLNRLLGEEIVDLQVLGINSLKTLSPAPRDLVGDVIERCHVDHRILTIFTGRHTIRIDLQRAGRLVWWSAVAPVTPGAGPRPTVRIALGGGQGVDLTEPSKTKRITITIAPSET